MKLVKITVDVDCKDPAWQAALDQVIADGHARSLKGVVLPGLPPVGYYEYKRRVRGGRVYLTYKTPGGQITIGSVNPEYADEARRWKPTPNCDRLFEFSSGSVVVHYDAMALPCRIVGIRT